MRQPDISAYISVKPLYSIELDGHRWFHLRVTSHVFNSAGSLAIPIMKKTVGKPVNLLVWWQWTELPEPMSFTDRINVVQLRYVVVLGTNQVTSSDIMSTSGYETDDNDDDDEITENIQLNWSYIDNYYSLKSRHHRLLIVSNPLFFVLKSYPSCEVNWTFS